MSLAISSLSADNPNDSVGGGGCVCHPGSKAYDCKGPYVVFQNAESLEPGSPHVVVSADCLRAALTQLRATSEAELPTTGEPINIQSIINQVPEPTVEWDDLTEYEQARASAAVPAGEIVKLGENQYVRVPEGAGSSPAPDTASDTEDPLVELAGELPLEEPGSQHGEYVPANSEEAAL